MEVQKKTYNVPEVAAQLGISKQLVYQLCKSDGFPAIHLGSRIVIPIDKLDEWLRDTAGKRGI